MINHKFPAGTEQLGAPRGSVVPSEAQWPQEGISGPGWMDGRDERFSWDPGGLLCGLQSPKTH